MKNDHITYCDLELISDDEWQAAQPQPTLKVWLQSAVKFITQRLASYHEPKIWATRDRFGVKHWHLYDASSCQTLTFGSENEILMWLDDRYYR